MIWSVVCEQGTVRVYQTRNQETGPVQTSPGEPNIASKLVKNIHTK